MHDLTSEEEKREFNKQFQKKEYQTRKIIEKTTHPLTSASTDMKVGELWISQNGSDVRLNVKLTNGEIWAINLVNRP